MNSLVSAKHFVRSSLVLLLVLLVVLGASYYQQYVKGDLPCLLCSVQRISLWLVVLAVSLAVATKKNSVRCWSLFSMVCFVLIGLAALLRQLWLQYMAVPDGAACLPGMSALMKTMPWHQAFLLLLRQSSGCTQIVWRFLGVNVSLWVLLIYLALMVYAVAALLTLAKQTRP